jgi:hypothetical protein
MSGTCPEIPDLIPDTSDMLNNTERLWEKNQKTQQMVTKNYEILNMATRHHGKGLHQISAPNTKV